MSTANNGQQSESQAKGRPTPKRKDAEAARQQGLRVPNGSKQARIAARERDREARRYARSEMMAGNPRYFPARDAGPVKAFVRQYIDSRRTVGELFVPVAMFVLLGGLIKVNIVQIVVLNTWLGLLAFVMIDTTIIGFRLSSLLKKNFANKSDRRGAVAYGVLRALQMRRFRIPPAMVKAGGAPVTPKKKSVK